VAVFFLLTAFSSLGGLTALTFFSTGALTLAGALALGVALALVGFYLLLGFFRCGCHDCFVESCIFVGCVGEVCSVVVIVLGDDAKKVRNLLVLSRVEKDSFVIFLVLFITRCIAKKHSFGPPKLGCSVALCTKTYTKSG
jgi:hypothetical protein